ncbi:hypothetical protein [Nocardia sp. Marseille-Q1738]
MSERSERAVNAAAFAVMSARREQAMNTAPFVMAEPSASEAES